MRLYCPCYTCGLSRFKYIYIYILKCCSLFAQIKNKSSLFYFVNQTAADQTSETLKFVCSSSGKITHLYAIINHFLRDMEVLKCCAGLTFSPDLLSYAPSCCKCKCEFKCECECAATCCGAVVVDRDLSRR